MKLIYDDYNQIYYWVSDDEKITLSPHFDYEEDAEQWYRQNYIKNKSED